MHVDANQFTAAQLADWVQDARQRTLAIYADVTGPQLLGPGLKIVNPPLWEMGHVGWFQEHWILRHTEKRPPLRADADSLFNSAAIPHGSRRELELPSWQETLGYLQDVQDGVLERLHGAALTPELVYFVLLTVFHEDMHGEAFLYTRQTLGYPAPDLASRSRKRPESATGSPSDVEIPGGEFLLGATKDEPFVFDNEQWAHPVKVQPFAIARAAVTQAEFAAFVEDGGYRRQELWSPAGRHWREAVGAEQPVYWRRGSDGSWQRRDFDRWLSLEPHRPIIHVNWHEADAWCRWAKRRLPTEAEWEFAAAMEPTGRKRRFPWGDQAPHPAQANLAAREMGCVNVHDCAAGDSPWGCRQMIGNVWEWTASAFLPYPGFASGPYREYSEPWFGNHRVLRGGCWVTQSRLLRNTWRNFYTPERRDIWAGFRTCRLDN
jgi:iron(II)-dependent oxidoreductase